MTTYRREDEQALGETDWGKAQEEARLLEQQLLETIRDGEQRTVILVLDEIGQMNGILFPNMDLRKQDDEDFIGPWDLVPLFADKAPEGTQIFMGHLWIDNGKLSVHLSSDVHARPADDEQLTRVLGEYFGYLPTPTA